MDAEETADEFFETLSAIAREEVSPNKLKNLLQKIQEDCGGDPLRYGEFLQEVFPDVICEEVNEIINDSQWRSGEIGPNALKNPGILRELYPLLTELDENNELVFASNPYIPKDIIEVLSDSHFEWEEDGTTSMLARVTNDQNIITKLSKSENVSTRFSVACNVNAPISVLQDLSNDEEFSRHMLYMQFDGGWHQQSSSIATDYVRCSIKYAVVQNTSTPIEIIKSMSESSRSFSFESGVEILGMTGDEINLAFQQEAKDILQSRE